VKISKSIIKEKLIDGYWVFRDALNESWYVIKEHGSKLRWLLLGLITFGAMHYAVVNMGLYSYIQSWGGAQFKILSGACMGWFLFRFVMRVDLSTMPLLERTIAGLSLAILMGLFGHAAATGS